MSASSLVPTIIPAGTGSVTITLQASWNEPHRSCRSYLIQATPSAGYRFVKFEYGYTYENLSSGEVYQADYTIYSASFNFDECTDHDDYYQYGNTTLEYVIAYFESDVPYYTVSTASQPVGGGITAGGGTFASGSSCTVTATANPGYVFDHWLENGTTIQGAGSTYTFSVYGNRALVAVFRFVGYSVFASSSPLRGGTVQVGSSPAGRISSETGIQYGSVVTVSAQAAQGFTFDRWSDGGAQVHDITVYQNYDLTAYFTADKVSIQTAEDPAAGGTTSGGGLYDIDTWCTLVATPNAGWSFLRWERDGVVESYLSTYKFYVRTYSGGTYTAVFGQSGQVPITARAVRPQGQQQDVGNVTIDGTNWVVSTTQMVDIGTVVTASAKSISHQWAFLCWKDDITGETVSTFPDYTFTVDSTRQISAYFSNTFAWVSAVPSPSYAHANGKVQINSSELSTGDISVDVAIGASAIVRCFPNDGYEFYRWGRWTGNDYIYYYDQELTVTPINTRDNYDLRAYFTKLYTVSTSISPPEAGSISGVDNPYHLGDSCSVMATPADGYMFSHWEDSSGTALSTSELYSFTISDDVTIVAVFLRILNVTTSPHPPSGGTTTGDGQYVDGSNCTVSATPASHYSFVEWRTDGYMISKSPEFTFEVTEDMDLVAVFEKDHDHTHRLVYDPARLNFFVYDPVTGRLVADYYADSTAPP